MTNPVQSTSSALAAAAPARPSPQPSAPATPAAFTVEVSRADTAPVYVYRMTDTATGRVLVEIPNDPKASTAGGPGGKVDAKV